ncbi:hypothetical protein BD414DRAFT_316100 [Trametes punicea]|nr:hypothetical protein BD414DRAFT_316100 [Trametes punicea]
MNGSRLVPSTLWPLDSQDLSHDSDTPAAIRLSTGLLLTSGPCMPVFRLTLQVANVFTIDGCNVGAASRSKAVNLGCRNVRYAASYDDSMLPIRRIVLYGSPDRKRVDKNWKPSQRIRGSGPWTTRTEKLYLLTLAPRNVLVNSQRIRSGLLEVVHLVAHRHRWQVPAQTKGRWKGPLSLSRPTGQRLPFPARWYARS